MALVAGFFLAGIVTALLSLAPLVWTVILLGGLIALIPALVIRDPIRYWLVMFLLATMVDVKENDEIAQLIAHLDEAEIRVHGEHGR